MRTPPCAPLVATLLLLVGSPGQPPARAQSAPAVAPKAPNGTEAAPEDPLGRSTPHGTVVGFIRSATREEYGRAAEYLQTRSKGTDAQELARQLKTVLDLGLKVDLDSISRDPLGNLNDGLSPDLDRAGTVPAPSGELEILLVRVQRRNQPAFWQFSSDTLQRIPVVASELTPFDVDAYVPRRLAQMKLFSFPLSHWIAVFLLLPISLLVGSILTRVLVLVLRFVLRRVSTASTDRALGLLKDPIRLVLIAIAIKMFSTLSMTLIERQFWTRVAATIAVAGAAWLAIRLGDIVAESYARRLRRRQTMGRIAMLALGRRLFKVLVVIVAALVLLHRAGADLTAILTGLGIGGVGLALAAQKTLENLFGGVMIIADEPIRVGDFCRVGDQMGTVEDIGVRSTRIRTLSRTMVSVPNGQLASMNIENFTLRDKFWFRHVIGVRYETTADQLRYLLAEVRRLLYAHPKVEREGARIRFVGFGASSLDLEIFAYVWAVEMPEFLAIQEDLLLRIMDLIAQAGTSIAFPSQTTYFTRDTPLDRDKRDEAIGKVGRWREGGDLPFPDFRADQIQEARGEVEYPPAGSAVRKD